MTQKKSFRNRMGLLIILSALFFSISIDGSAQSSIDISKKVEGNKKEKGDALIHTEEGKFKLYGTYSKLKLTSLYAVDNAGNRIEAKYESKTDTQAKAASVVCYVCIENGNGTSQCYKIDCHLSPAPPPTKNVK